jgi:energy-coupling factor transporter ATP-binding protein EcfA2
METTIIILVGPILFLVFMYLLVKLIIAVTRALIPFILSRFKKTEGKKKFLELTFPSDTSKSAYATKQLYTLFHTLAKQKSLIESLTQTKKQYSLEIVSTKNEGIRFLLIANAKDANILKPSLLSYLPGIKIKEVDDYLDKDINLNSNQSLGIAELKLSSHFALPLNNQKTLSEHDPISYLTGNMTNLDLGELISFQVVVTPVLSSTQGKIVNEMKKLRYRMYKGLPLTEALQKSPLQEVTSLPVISLIWLGVKGIFFLLKFTVMFVYSMVIAFIDNNIDNTPFATRKDPIIPQELLNPYEQELKTVVKEKIDQSLFESTIRILVIGKNEEEFNVRMSGLLASFGPMSSAYQTLLTKGSFGKFSLKSRLLGLKQRALSKSTAFNQNPILSTSEISDIYHFPYTDTTKTEDIVKTLSRELPAPLSLKQGRDLDVVFAKSTYGNTIVDIGLTDEERAKHVYLIGRTGSGKSTVIFHMASFDIQKGRGLAVIDPHGDLAEDLLSTVPKNRINDLIYFDPFDLGHPIGINLLELPEGLSDDEFELEKELVAESVISVFRRVFQREENTNAHRIEYILRNTIYTAFYVPDRTIFTVYDLLNNPDFRDKVINDIDDENLINFWKYEFGMAGNYQVVKMVSGVTAKVGRFLFSPTAKRILEQPKSTINFDEILDSHKILICNVSEGKLGEDTSQILGLTIISKIQQAALRRARTESTLRSPFYLFVDEFQNFATTSFTRILSGGRKFGLRMTLAEQSTSQQQDKNVVNVILANTGTVICFATASPLDEEMMQPQFGSYITKADIANLPNHNFYIKMSATKPEEPFSGETIKITLKKDKQKIQKLIEASRKNYASVYVRPKKKVIVKKANNKAIKSKSKKALPDK